MDLNCSRSAILEPGLNTLHLQIRSCKFDSLKRVVEDLDSGLDCQVHELLLTDVYRQGHGNENKEVLDWPIVYADCVKCVDETEPNMRGCQQWKQQLCEDKFAASCIVMAVG